MNCSICKQMFITTKNKQEYYIKKAALDNELGKFVDENMENNESGCWKKVLNTEALLLKPNENPKFCPAEICGAIICNYCYKQYISTCTNCPVCNNH